MTLAATSVVVVSRGRPEALARCLLALGQLDHPAFEIVVVSDTAGLAATGRSGRIRRIAFDEPNISAARNAGIRVAAGEVVAFIDDDAVPEPTWLSRLTAPFADPVVGAAGGLVRGRNGLSVQWGPAEVTPAGDRRPLDLPGGETVLLPPPPGGAIKTEGTNMAVRRATLATLGGFDPAYRFYLDETDLNLRLARIGTVTAWVPGAEVLHGFEASARRRADRVPLDLHEIGASLAVLTRRHGAAPAAVRAAAEAEQHRRLVGHMVAGRIEPRDVTRLLDGFAAGWDDGHRRPLGPLPPLPAAEAGFLPWAPARPWKGHVVLSGPARDVARLRAEAATAVAEGWRTTLIVLSRGARYHRVRFNPGGWWEQAGGLSGRAVRSDPLWRGWTFADRIEREALRCSVARGIDAYRRNHD